MVDSLPEELRAQAKLLLTLTPNQANLRRSVATNYYALFHLLVMEATRLWVNPAHRSALARQFDHKRMKVASAELKRSISSDRSKLSWDQYEIRRSLVLVASNFAELQEKRHEADYDLSKLINVDEAKSCDDLAYAAMEAWKQVRDEPIAHDYLYSLLFRDR